MGKKSKKYKQAFRKALSVRLHPAEVSEPMPRKIAPSEDSMRESFMQADHEKNEQEEEIVALETMYGYAVSERNPSGTPPGDEDWARWFGGM